YAGARAQTVRCGTRVAGVRASESIRPPEALPPLLSAVQTTETSEVIMNFKYVVAIVRPDAVESLEARFKSLGVGGITLTKVKGFGEYKNFFTGDWLTEHTKIEIFTEASKVEPLLGVFLEA